MMTNSVPPRAHHSDHTELRAVILAAGNQAITADGQPLVLQALGDRSVLDCVVQNALQVVPPEDIYIVVGHHRGQIQTRLGSRYHYVVQEEPRGTGDAVLQVSATLGEFRGNLLVLYGDTPLF